MVAKRNTKKIGAKIKAHFPPKATEWLTRDISGCACMDVGGASNVLGNRPPEAGGNLQAQLAGGPVDRRVSHPMGAEWKELTH